MENSKLAQTLSAVRFKVGLLEEVSTQFNKLRQVLMTDTPSEDVSLRVVVDGVEVPYAMPDDPAVWRGLLEATMITLGQQVAQLWADLQELANEAVAHIESLGVSMEVATHV